MPDKITYNEAFLEYLYTVFSTNKGSLNFDLTKQIFLASLKDYFEERIDVHTFSSVSTSIYYDFNEPSSFDINPTLGALGKMLYISSELEWNIKNNEDSVKSIEILKKYYQNNKNPMS